MAPSAKPPSRNTFALLDAADESHTGTGADVDAATEEDNDVDHMDSTA